MCLASAFSSGVASQTPVFGPEGGRHTLERRRRLLRGLRHLPGEAGPCGRGQTRPGEHRVHRQVALHRLPAALRGHQRAPARGHCGRRGALQEQVEITVPERMKTDFKNPPKSPFRKGGLLQPELPELKKSLEIPPFGKGGSGGICLTVHYRGCFCN